MRQGTNYIQKQYEGFLQTPNLWKGTALCGLEQFELHERCYKITVETPEFRLGKRVEQFVAFQLQKEQVSILGSNIQIKNNKETLGEIDFIIQQNQQIIHLEVCHKYYLYDSNIDGLETEKWIGPNRRDSLYLKLQKLKNKQFPLLQKEPTKKHLASLGIILENTVQKVLFKAELYLPAHAEFKNRLPIDETNIRGYYYRLHELQSFTNSKFYIPKKPDWLRHPVTQTDWLNFDDFKQRLTIFMQSKNAPLCWLKKPSGSMEKIFVVWW